MATKYSSTYRVDVNRGASDGYIEMYEGADQFRAIHTYMYYGTPELSNCSWVKLYKGNVLICGHDNIMKQPADFAKVVKALQEVQRTEKYASLAQMKKANHEIGGEWFESCPSFNSHPYSKVYGGRYFVESTWRIAQEHGDVEAGGTKVYAWRVMQCLGGKINCVVDSVNNADLVYDHESAAAYAEKLGLITRD